jgi:hypothetical protein
MRGHETTSGTSTPPTLVDSPSAWRFKMWRIRASFWGGKEREKITMWTNFLHVLRKGKYLVGETVAHYAGQSKIRREFAECVKRSSEKCHE